MLDGVNGRKRPGSGKRAENAGTAVAPTRVMQKLQRIFPSRATLKPCGTAFTGSGTCKEGALTGRGISNTFLVAAAALRMVACTAEQDGTILSGTVNMTRTDGSETGQTGFVFPQDTLLDAGPFTGSCEIQRGSEGDTLSLWIQRTQPDPFGLEAFGIVSPIEPAVEPGKASVSAEASGVSFEDLEGSCTVVFGGYDEYAGSVDIGLDCGGLAVQNGSASSGTVGLSASLSLDACEVSE